MSQRQTFRHHLARMLVCALFLAVGMLTYGGGIASAATPSAEPSQPAAPLSRVITVNPTYQNGARGLTFAVTVYWDGFGHANEIINIDWNDLSNNDDYLCGFNCESGSHTFYHTYSTSGFYDEGFTWSDGGGSASFTIEVD